MSDCQGEIALATKIDASMDQFVESAAAKQGVSRAELLRRLLDFYRESHQEATACPSCGEPVVMQLGP
jgi:negative regulator of replication initiation